MPLDQNPYQTVSRFGCASFFMKIRTIFCAPNAIILLVYIPAKIKMRFIWKHNFFSKIGIFCKSISGNISQRCSSIYTTIFVRRKDTNNYLWNQTLAKCYHSQNKHKLKEKRYMADPIYVRDMYPALFWSIFSINHSSSISHQLIGLRGSTICRHRLFSFTSV